MPHAEGSTVIAGRRPDEVFDFLADGANNPRWRVGVADISRETGAAVGLGTVYRQGMRGPMGRRIAADYRITEYDPGRALGFEVIAGPARPTGRYELTPTQSGTAVRFTLDWRPTGLARLLAPAVARQMPREVAALGRLKQVMEAGPA
ncbi:MAG TPA: SRPBCC family protein [Micromonosporaceae bacterium]|jgi:uncharacterized protein YndB with AHSA1/START domain